MKNLRTAVCCVSITLFSLCSLAQKTTIPINEPDYKKPRLFQNMPENVPVSMNGLNALLQTGLNRNVDLNLADKLPFRFTGEVISSASSDDNRINSVVIRSSNFNGANLTLSRIIKPDGTISFTGRLISFQSGDLYVLQNNDGVYSLVKKNFYELVNE